MENRFQDRAMPNDKRLGMMIDLGMKLKSGAVTQEEVSLFLKRRNPFCGIHFNEEVLDIIVDDRRPYADAIAAGNYHYIVELVTFPLPRWVCAGEVRTQVRLLDFKEDLLDLQNISDREVLREMRFRDVRPVSLWELWAIGEQHPHKQEERCIVCLDQAYNSQGRGYPILDFRGKDRGFALWPVSKEFDGERCIFAAVNKEPIENQRT